MGIYYLVAFPRTREFLSPGRLKDHGIKQFAMIHGEVAKLAMMEATSGNGPIFVVNDCGDAYYAVKALFKDITVKSVADFNEMFLLEGDPPLELETDQQSYDYKYPPDDSMEDELKSAFGDCLGVSK